jgi:tripartite-type tricarboxylate transporter receptor subunit TctC
MLENVKRLPRPLLLALAAFCLPAHSQAYPARPVRLVIGSFAGGGIDLAGRIIAQKMSETAGQQVIVDNRGGANGIIGMETVARAAPDGHTFYMGTAGHIAVNPMMYSKLPFNVDRDFEPLTQVVSLPFLVYAHASLPFKAMPDLIAHAKANPGTLTWSSSGDGGLPHLAGELIRLASGIDTRRIPYKGSAPAFNDLLGGRVNYCIEAVSIGLQHVKTGRLVALAATGPARLDILPGVATLNETLPGVQIVNWYGALLPHGTSKEIVGRLHALMIGAMNTPDVRAKLAANGFDANGTTPEQFRAFRKAEEARWGKVIKQAGIQQQ